MSLLVDTHSHLYSRQFDKDRPEAIRRAKEVLSHLFLPNVDSESVNAMLEMTRLWPGFCFAMMGLHPCSVKEDYREELRTAEKHFADAPGFYKGVGECGLDYYWDKTFIPEQKAALEVQIDWAKTLDLPLILHCRESMDDVISMVEQAQDGRLRGIFHCFTGTIGQAQKIRDAGFLMGIGGVVTYKNSGLAEVVKELPLESLVLETDSPYLAPAPYRGKRNESAYVRLVADKICELINVTFEEVAGKTSAQALKLFRI